MRSFVLALVCAPCIALGQTQLPDLDLNQIDVNSSAASSLVVGTGEILPPGTFRMALATAYENNPSVSFENGRLVGDLISNRFTLHLVGGWAPFDWLEFGADVPFVASQDGVDLDRYGLPSTGIGQPVAIMRVGVLSQAKGAGFDMAVQLGARLPFAPNGRWQRDERIAVAPKLMVGRHFGWFRAGGEIGVRYRPDPTVRGADDPANQVLLGAALTSGAPDSVRVELTARTTVSFARQRGPVDVLGGVRVPFGIFDLFALAGPNFDNGGGGLSFKVMTGVTFGSASGVQGNVAGPSTTGSPGAGTPASGAPDGGAYPPPAGAPDPSSVPTDFPTGFPTGLMPGASTTGTGSSTQQATSTEGTQP